MRTRRGHFYGNKYILNVSPFLFSFNALRFESRSSILDSDLVDQLVYKVCACLFIVFFSLRIKITLQRLFRYAKSIRETIIRFFESIIGVAAWLVWKIYRTKQSLVFSKAQETRINCSWKFVQFPASDLSLCTNGLNPYLVCPTNRISASRIRNGCTDKRRDSWIYRFFFSRTKPLWNWNVYTLVD